VTGPRVVVVQSNYLPWKGYFDLISEADIFVFYDDLQFTKNDWRNRNRIKTSKGTEWLTVPVGQSLDRLVSQVKLESSRWQAKHFRTLEQNYRRAPHFERYRPFLEDVYLATTWKTLSELNHHLIRVVATEFLGLRPHFLDSREFQLEGVKLARLLDLLKQVGAGHYISGPNAKAYIDPRAFEEANIGLEFIDYSGYPEYPQFHPPFDHAVSILDTLFHLGPSASSYVVRGKGAHLRAMG
jgi:WbqC-like protein family